MEATSDRQLSRYVLGKEIGRGTSGVVFEAHDLQSQRIVAYKTLHRDTKLDRQALRFEACLLSSLRHPGVIPVFDLGHQLDGRPFYTMPLVQGISLEERMEQKDFSLEEGLLVLQDVCSILDFFHKRGVIHCDVKPSNILLSEDGRTWLIDWGTAELRSDCAFPFVIPAHLDGFEVFPLREVKLKGSPLYVAPELLKKQACTPAVDQYALGVMLYQLLTNRTPFDFKDVPTLLYQTSNRKPISPVLRAPLRNLPEALVSLSMGMLAKEPSDRFASCADIAHFIGEWLERCEVPPPSYKSRQTNVFVMSSQ